MKITKEWIMNHRTLRGAWTGSQLRALGINGSPAKGWMHRLIGTEISDENAVRFESGKDIFSKKTLKNLEKEGRTDTAILKKRIDALEDWISVTGHTNKICTKEILNNPCLACWCGE